METMQDYLTAQYEDDLLPSPKVGDCWVEDLWENMNEGRGYITHWSLVFYGDAWWIKLSTPCTFQKVGTFDLEIERKPNQDVMLVHKDPRIVSYTPMHKFPLDLRDYLLVELV